MSEDLPTAATNAFLDVGRNSEKEAVTSEEQGGEGEGEEEHTQVTKKFERRIRDRILVTLCNFHLMAPKHTLFLHRTTRTSNRLIFWRFCYAPDQLKSSGFPAKAKIADDSHCRPIELERRIWHF